MTPLKAEYIGADQLPFFIFRLQRRGGPYIPIIPAGSRELADPECKLPIPKGLHIVLSVSPEYPSDRSRSLVGFKTLFV
jgi:hypothetical protein